MKIFFSKIIELLLQMSFHLMKILVNHRYFQNNQIDLIFKQICDVIFKLHIHIILILI